MGGNTVDCRIYHANNANISGDAVHCLHATPSGGGVCGSLCDVYCAMALKVCTGNLSLFSDSTTCKTACAAFNTSGAPGAPTGDSIQCRIYHIGAAAALDDRITHCPHGNVSSTQCNNGATSSSSASSPSQHQVVTPTVQPSWQTAPEQTNNTTTWQPAT